MIMNEFSSKGRGRWFWGLFQWKANKPAVSDMVNVQNGPANTNTENHKEWWLQRDAHDPNSSISLMQILQVM